MCVAWCYQVIALFCISKTKVCRGLANSLHCGMLRSKRRNVILPSMSKRIRERPGQSYSSLEHSTLVSEWRLGLGLVLEYLSPLEQLAFWVGVLLFLGHSQPMSLPSLEAFQVLLQEVRGLPACYKACYLLGSIVCMLSRLPPSTHSASGLSMCLERSDHPSAWRGWSKSHIDPHAGDPPPWPVQPRGSPHPTPC